MSTQYECDWCHAVFADNEQVAHVELTKDTRAERLHICGKCVPDFLQDEFPDRSVLRKGDDVEIATDGGEANTSFVTDDGANASHHSNPDGATPKVTVRMSEALLDAIDAHVDRDDSAMHPNRSEAIRHACRKVYGEDVPLPVPDGGVPKFPYGDLEWELGQVIDAARDRLLEKEAEYGADGYVDSEPGYHIDRAHHHLSVLKECAAAGDLQESYFESADTLNHVLMALANVEREGPDVATDGGVPTTRPFEPEPLLDDREVQRALDTPEPIPDGGRHQCIGCGEPYDRGKHDACPRCSHKPFDEYVTDGGERPPECECSEWHRMVGWSCLPCFRAGFEEPAKDSTADQQLRADGGRVRCCPECDSPRFYARCGDNVAVRGGQRRRGDPEDSYLCRACGATFNEPATRGCKHSGATAGHSGPAQALADPDVGPDDVLPDGGQLDEYQAWIGEDCPECGVEIDEGSLRYGRRGGLEHKNPEAHPQAGHHLISETVDDGIVTDGGTRQSPESRLQGARKQLSIAIEDGEWSDRERIALDRARSTILRVAGGGPNTDARGERAVHGGGDS